MRQIKDRVAAFIASPRIVMIAAGIAVVLNLPAIPTGWYLDDLVHRANFLEVGPLSDSSDMTNGMFDFLSGEPEEILAYKDLGVLPWWAEDQLRIRFWRPLSSFTHVVDYHLWPSSGAWMHLHSLAWLVSLIVATALLYRRLIVAPLVAGLAALLYALDDAHGMPTAFLANRNAMVAATFGVLSLWWHDRHRRDGWTPGAILSPLAFLAALLGGESGLGIAPYLLGYALFLERKTGSARFASIAPHAVVGISWLVFYKLGGYGTFGSGFYLDPIGQPTEWFPQFLIRAPLLLLGQWFLPPASFAFSWTPEQTIAVSIFGVVFLTLVFMLLRPILKNDPTARFFAFGMLLAVVPITAGFPHDRLSFFVGIGAMALLAMLLVRLFDRSITPGFSRRLFAWVLVVVHVFIAAPFQIVMNTAVASQEPFYADAPRSLPDDPKLENQRLLIVNTPNAFYAQYTLIVRLFDSKPTPESILLMAPGATTLTVARISQRMLSIEAENGWLASPFDIVYRDPARKLPDDYQIRLSGVSIQVATVTPDGRPEKVNFAFEEVLEAEALRWVRYQDGRYVPFELPAIGQSTVIDPVPFDLFSRPD